MSDTGYIVWFIAQTVVVTGLLVLLVLEGTGTLGGRHTSTRRSPQESKQYWPHVRQH